MKFNRFWVCCAVGAALQLVGNETAHGHSAASAYDQIPGRNVFRLKAPEALVVKSPSPVLATVRLTGITTLFTHKLALLTVLLPAQSGEPAQEVPLSLEEGQSERNIAVLAINEKAGRVELLNFGTRVEVAFDSETPRGSASAGLRPLPLRP